MKKISSILCLMFFTLFLTNTFSQTTIEGLSGTQLADIIAGEGVSITNVTLSCPDGASAEFLGAGSPATNIGLDAGVLLTTGNVSQAFGPNTAGNSSIDNGGGGDADLSAASGFTTFNACVLEFDFVPSANGLSVEFVFASEEYNEWVCTQFNDVFAFFVTGPIPGGGGTSYNNQNIALVPGVGSPVAINTINNGTAAGSSTPCDLSNSALHINNIGGSTIQYDGFTIVLTASLDLVPCQSYHFKFAIADASDAIFDSGVFINAASFQTNNIVATATDSPEGCPGGEITFTTTLPNTAGYTIDITVLGSSTASASDYEPFPQANNLPIGQNSLSIPIVSIADILNEGNETIDFEFTYNPTGGCDPTTDNASISIIDGPITCEDFLLVLGSDGTASITPDDVLTGDLTVDCPSFDFTLSKEDFVCSDEGPNVVTVTADDGNGNISECEAIVTVELPPDPILTIDLGDQCRPVYWGYGPLECTDITAAVAGGTPPYAYAWSNGEVTQTITVCPTVTTQYDVTVTDSNGCEEVSEMVEVEVVDVRCGKNLNKVLVCHVPAGNPSNEHNICISPNAVPSHLGLHGSDYLGFCGEFPCDDMIFPMISKPSGDLVYDQDPSKEVGENITVYPNPTNGSITLDIPNIDIERIEILDVGGKAAVIVNSFKGERTIHISETANLEEGVYLIRVTSKSGVVYTRRFLKM